MLTWNMYLQGQMLRERILMNNWGWQFSGLGFGAGVVFGMALLVAVLWTLYWKYRALWHAAKHDHKVWFLVFLVVNTLGILEILYLHIFSKYHKN